MKFYIFIAIAAYLAFAVNSVIDKFLLKKAIPESATYAFYIGILSNFAIVLAPIQFTIPTFSTILVALASGMCFIYALIFFYEGLKRADTSVVLPTIGGLQPIVALGLSFLLVHEWLNGREITGLILLVAGTLLISNKREGGDERNTWFWWSIGAAVFFAASFSLAKVVYEREPFISALIWTRFGLLAGALTILAVPSARRNIFHTTKSMQAGSGALFFAGQILAAGGGLLQNYAVSLGSVTIVNALQGSQFAFLFVMTGFLSRYYPDVLKEDFSRATVRRKVIAIILIGVGLGLTF